MSAPARETGRSFGRYRLVEKIGAGGMAVVYRAIADGPEGFARSFVIKRVLPELSRDPNFAKMLVAEARLSAMLHHPGIVQVFELGQFGDEYYLAMEHIDGIDLVTLLNRCIKVERRLPVGLVCYIVSELAAALAYAHELKDEQGRSLNIIHRDISPSNVMITQSGAVKLLDFGIARAADHVRDERTRTGKLKGKISYLSPEQADGRDIDHRADIFALGILLYECLTMKRLFRGSDDLATLREVREANVPPPSELMPDIDSDLDAIALRMLARDPVDRFTSCNEVGDALAPIIHRLEGDAAALRRFVAEIGPFDHKGQKVDSDPSLPRYGSFAAPSPGLRWGLWAGAALSILVAGAVTTWAVVHHRSRGVVLPPTVIVAPPTTAPPVAPPTPSDVAPPAAPAIVKVPIRSQPAGALVLVDGKPVGTTPLLVPLTLPGQIELLSDGYRPARALVTKPDEMTVHLVRTRVPTRPPPHRPHPTKKHIGLD